MEEQLPKLIVDLALILCVGAVTTLICKRIKQPLVLGYIIAGFLVGPHFVYIPNVTDEHNVEIWAKIGVIFLLFSLGLEFSFKKLLNVGGSASITALVEIVSIVALGFYAGKWMGWGTMDSLFLGGLLASSSTTIIIRAFEELGLKRKKFASVVFGVLIVEDIVVILLMVMLSTMAVTQQFNGADMLDSMLKLSFFLVIWFVGGIFIIPSFLRAIKRYLDEETLLIIAIGLCLGMVYIADSAGFSIELGAFVMGSILAETIFAEKIEAVMKPVKTLFATIFFISIGMMIDPSSMYEYRWAILVVTLITIFGKMFATLFGALLSGQTLKQSTQVGMSMAQIGEFAFIVAGLGLSLGVTSEFLFPVAVGASAITTFTTPYMIKFSEPAYERLNKILPQKLLTAISKYSSDTQHIQHENKWKTLLKKSILSLFINSMVIIALTLLVQQFVSPLLGNYFNKFGVNLTSLLITFIISIPFIWAIIGDKSTKNIKSELWEKAAIHRGPIIVITIVRFVIFFGLVIFIYDQFFNSFISSLLLACGLVILFYFLSKNFKSFYDRIVNKFIYNLNEREIVSQELQNEKDNNYISTWDDTHITDIKVPEHASFLGILLDELNWRNRFKINIAYIKRGDLIIQLPDRERKIYPFDTLGIIGNDEQIQAFETYLHEIKSEPLPYYITDKVDNISLVKILIDRKFCEIENHTIRWMKEQTKGGIIVSIERNGKINYSPNSEEKIQLGDYITLVADKKELKSFVKLYNLVI